MFHEGETKENYWGLVIRYLNKNVANFNLEILQEVIILVSK